MEDRRRILVLLKTPLHHLAPWCGVKGRVRRRGHLIPLITSYHLVRPAILPFLHPPHTPSVPHAAFTPLWSKPTPANCLLPVVTARIDVPNEICIKGVHSLCCFSASGHHVTFVTRANVQHRKQTTLDNVGAVKRKMPLAPLAVLSHLWCAGVQRLSATSQDFQKDLPY